jgi:thermitase
MILATIYAVSWVMTSLLIVVRGIFKHLLLRTVLPNRLILAGMSVYWFCVLWMHSRVDGTKTVQMLITDLLLWGAIALATWYFSSAKWSLWLLVLLIGAGSWWYYFDYQRAQAGYNPHQVQTALPSNATPAPAVAIPAETFTVASTGEILLDPRSTDDLEELKKMTGSWQVTFQKAFPDIAETDLSELDDYYVADIPDAFAAQRDQIVSLLRNSGRVEDVVLNEIQTLSPGEIPAAEENVTGTSSTGWPVNDPMADSMSHWKMLDFKAFYSMLSTKKPIKQAKIAILDTGVEAAHEDLTEHFISSGDFHDKDVVGHGTHCAGIAAAVTNNGRGVPSWGGLSGWTTVTSIKVLGDNGGGTQQAILAGIADAADRGADVISMSLGGPRNPLSQRLYDQAFQYANRQGAIVVVAAGNENRPAGRVLPSASPYVITVSAVDDNGQKASFSNYFNNYEQEMGIAAPGVRILSTFPGQRYRRLSGTSMATPCVAGVLGVLKALRPELTTQQAWQILNNTGIETGNTARTGKLIQPDKAVQAVVR